MCLRSFGLLILSYAFLSGLSSIISALIRSYTSFVHSFIWHTHAVTHIHTEGDRRRATLVDVGLAVSFRQVAAQDAAARFWHACWRTITCVRRCCMHVYVCTRRSTTLSTFRTSSTWAPPHNIYLFVLLMYYYVVRAYVCMYVCVYVCMYVCMYVCHVCTQVIVSVCRN